jgi:predicted branched-subunit amino acid permease
MRGVRDALGVPLLVLMATFAGFVGLARDAGIGLGHTLYMVAFIWALPAQVVLVAQISAGASLLAATVAVTLSSVRLMPMVVALLPELRTPQTRRRSLYLVAGYIAVTSWVIGMTRAREIPRRSRIAWFAGVETTLVAANLGVATAVHLLAAGLPPLVSGLLAFLMPTYFLASLWTTARENASRLALAAGLTVGPAVHWWSAEFDLIAAGLAGGVAGILSLRAARP